MFTPIEKSFLSLAFIPCAVLQFIIYRYAKHRLVGESETIEKRMEKWFATMSGVMLGIFIFRTLPQSAAVVASNTFLRMGWSYRALAAFVMLGFYSLMWVDKLSRVWPYSTTYAGLSPQEASDSLQTDHIIDPKRIEQTEYYDCSDLGSPVYNKDLSQLQAEASVLARNRRNAILLYMLMIFVCVIEGLYLVYRQDVALGGTGGIVGCFYVDKLLESLVVGAVLVYGRFHAFSKPYWFLALCILWWVVIILSTVPVLSDAPVAEIAVAIEHPALGVCYAIAAGFIFYIAIYFIFVNRVQTDRREMILRLLAFGVGLWIPFVTSIFM
jgi:zinc transporter ZupT